MVENQRSCLVRGETRSKGRKVIIIEEEVFKVLKKMSGGKSAGVYGICGENLLRGRRDHD